MSDGVVLGSVPQIRRALRDVEHELALVQLWDVETVGHALATVDAATGDVIAWDGIYYGDDPPVEPRSVLDLDFDDWDDMPSKLLLQANGPWLASLLGYSLIPHYSVARCAAELTQDWGEGETTGLARKTLRRSLVVAYLPVVDRDVYDRFSAEAD